MGMIADVYRRGNVSLSGVIERVCLVNVDGPFEPKDDCPAAMVVPGNLRGTAKVVLVSDNGRHTMMGGSYVATSDSRFSQKVEEIVGGRFYGAVPFHDRVE